MKNVLSFRMLFLSFFELILWTTTTSAFLFPSLKVNQGISVSFHSKISGNVNHRSTCINMRQSYDDDSKASRPPLWFSSTMLGVIMASVWTVLPPMAGATYSAYTHREEDWQQRQASGTIQVSNPKMLRDQLRAIAPMNDESTFLFCPNGPSAAVSPLMENRCGDRQATPSVFGRSDDVLGNSIPGFSKDWMSTVSSASAADTGGLPEYGFTAGRKAK